MSWGFTLYRSVEAEQREWAAQAAERLRAEELRKRMTPDMAYRIVAIRKQYPWLPAGTVVTAAEAKLDDESLRKLGQAGAKWRGGSVKTGKTGWAKVGDVVTAVPKAAGLGDVAGAARAVGSAVGSAAGAAGRKVTEVGTDVVQGAVELAGGNPMGGASGGGSNTRGGSYRAPIARQQQEVVEAGIGDIGSAVKTASRVGLAATQYPLEVTTGAARSVLSGNYEGMGMLAAGPSPETLADVNEQTTLGQALDRGAEATEGGGFNLGAINRSLGEGFFPAGEAAKRQAEAARAMLSVDGHAWTPGRALAAKVVEPGTKPYTVLSGLVDAGVAWYGDPGAMGLGKVGELKKAEQALGALSTADDVNRARRAAGSWGDEIDEAVGLISGGHRPTVVPTQVEKYLYSDGFKRIATRIAETSSPSEIWRAADKKLSPELAAELARIDDPAQVAAALRPHLGLDVLPMDLRAMSRGGLNPFAGLDVTITSNAQQRARSLNVMPETYLPWDDPDTLIRNLDNSLANVKINGEERRALMDEAFRTIADPSEGKRVRLMNTITKSVERTLVDGYGVDESLARQLTSWTQEQDRLRAFFIDDLGNNVNFSFLVDDSGEAISRAKPTAIMDMLNSGTFVYDPAAVRDLRRLTSKMNEIVKLGPITIGTGSRAFQWPVSFVTFFQQELWKPLQMIRPAFFARVNSEEVVRGLASGKFDNAWDWLHFAGRGRGEIDATGGMFDLAKEADDIATRLARGEIDDIPAAQSRLEQINQAINDGKTAYDEARIGRTTKFLDLEQAEQNMVRSGNWARVRKDTNPYEWTRGIADEAIRMFEADPIMRRVANGGLFEGDLAKNARPGLDGIKDWLREGTGTVFRRKFEEAYPGQDWTSEALLDELVELARQRVKKVTGDNADLREVVATGKLNGQPAWVKTKTGSSPTDEFLARIDEFRGSPEAPLWQRYEQRAEITRKGGKTVAGEAGKAKEEIMRFFFGNLYGRTSDYLARSPVFKAEYWTRMEYLMPYLDEASRTEVLTNAVKAELGRGRVKRLAEAAKAPAGAVDLEAADALAKGWALDKTQELLFDASEKSQFFDIARAVFPFGEAWKEVLGRWATILKENPQVPRRAQQIVQGARGADLDGDGQGFFYRDPATGEEMFAYPLAGELANLLGVDNVEFQGSVQGLSLGTTVMPGLGPVAAVSVDRILPDVPDTDFVRSILFAYGDPQSVLGSVAPAWAKKLVGAWQANPDKDRIYANTLLEVTRQLASTGEYGVTPDERERLLNDARDQARVITGMRGVLQAVVPSSPQIQYLAETEKGDVVAGLLVQDFAALQEADYDTAVEKFLDKYGEQAMAYMIGKTRSTVGGQQASTAYGDWERENGDLIRKYKDVAGYFAPQDEGFNSTVFQRQQAQGTRVRRTPEEVLADAEAMVARWQYDQAKAQLGERPTKEQSAWLRDVKAALIEDYPGWNPDAVPNNLPGKIRTLQKAKDDDKIAGTEIGEALDKYFTARDQAIEAAGGAGRTTLATAKKTAYLRDWLRQVGGALSEDYPQFSRVWDEVLSRELKDDTVEDEDG